MDVRHRVRGKAALAAEAWRLMFDFFIGTRAQRDRILRELELTPGDAKAMSSLRPDEGRTMGSLAEDWLCDASNATWMVDRLEERGLIERRPHPTDRRVKLVVLTPAGAAVKARLLEGLYEAPAELLALSREDLDALREALGKLPRTGG